MVLYAGTGLGFNRLEVWLLLDSSSFATYPILHRSCHNVAPPPALPDLDGIIWRYEMGFPYGTKRCSNFLYVEF